MTDRSPRAGCQLEVVDERRVVGDVLRDPGVALPPPWPKGEFEAFQRENQARRRELPLSSETRLFTRICPCPVMGITGSSGKTTTKELALALLQGQQGVIGTPGNRNNEIGLPWTLLRMRRGTRFAPGRAMCSRRSSAKAVAFLRSVLAASMASAGMRRRTLSLAMV